MQINILYSEKNKKYYENTQSHLAYLLRKIKIKSVENDLNSTDYLAVIVFIDVHLFNTDGVLDYLELLKTKKITIYPIKVSPVNEEMNPLKSIKSANPHKNRNLEEQANDTIYAYISDQIINNIKEKI